MIIRAEQAADEPAISRVHKAAFPTSAEAQLVDALRSAGHLRVSLVAIVEGQIVGHVAFSPVTIRGTAPPSSAPAGWGLAPLAVLPEFERRGIGAALVRAGLEQCRSAEVGYVVLLGSPHYYGRFGFRAARQWRLTDEYQGGDAFQALELLPGTIPTGGGLVRYGPEFAIFSK